MVLSGLPTTAAQRLRHLIRVRDAIRECLRAQWQSRPEEDLLHTRAALNQAYDGFIAKFGPLSERRNVVAFRGDPDLPLLLSVEHYDRESGRAKKAALFHERTIPTRGAPVEVTDAKSALLVTLNERGRVDLRLICSLLPQSEVEVLSQLKGLVFLNPQTQRWETDDDYLSGNVRAKLVVAEAGALTDPRFQENVVASTTDSPSRNWGWIDFLWTKRTTSRTCSMSRR